MKGFHDGIIRTKIKKNSRRMKVAVLIRFPGRDQGTLGMLLAPSGFRCHAIELPDRGNRQNVSRIQAGEYRCTWHKSPRFGWCFWVRNVPERSGVLMHPGNLAGDTSKGYKTHSHGCILPGRYRGRMNGQVAVKASRPAMRDFNKAMGKEDFTLRIVEL